MAASSLLVDGMEGYLADDLEAFVIAAEARREELKRAIGAAQDRCRRALDAVSSAADLRRDIAACWVAALREADAIREAADGRAAAIVARAETRARELTSR